LQQEKLANSQNRTHVSTREFAFRKAANQLISFAYRFLQDSAVAPPPLLSDGLRLPLRAGAGTGNPSFTKPFSGRREAIRKQCLGSLPRPATGAAMALILNAIYREFLKSALSTMPTEEARQ
jgi:hypothetical protein